MRIGRAEAVERPVDRPRHLPPASVAEVEYDRQLAKHFEILDEFHTWSSTTASSTCARR